MCLTPELLRKSSGASAMKAEPESEFRTSGAPQIGKTESSYPMTVSAVKSATGSRRIVCLLDDAAPLFRSGTCIPGAGALLALSALFQSGVFDCARDIYGSIGPAFCGLHTTILALLLMALLEGRNAGQLDRSAA
jgi:hypothetical protein